MAENISLADAVALLLELKGKQSNANKAQMEAAFSNRMGLKKQRSVYVGNGYAIRFSEANTGSFSNVVLSLSALQKYDTNPIVICIVRPDRLDFRLANATFLKRISHSSHNFRVDNIRGSFLGHDIMDEYEGLPNRPDHFDELIAIHAEFTWEENVERLVEATNAIVARATRFALVSDNLSTILGAPTRAAVALNLARIAEIERELTAIVQRRRKELLTAAELDNVNIRGNTIEQLITGELNAHRLDDLTYDLQGDGTLIVDIKTKLLDRASAPKAYNIDKMLRTLSRPGSVFCFYFIGIDVNGGAIQSRIVSIFDPVVLSATRIQMHWAGRESRGVTQLTGNISEIFAPHYRPSVDVQRAKVFLTQLIER
jgi:hypothetical protein